MILHVTSVMRHLCMSNVILAEVTETPVGMSFRLT